MIPNAVIVSPWAYVLFPGAVITGVEFAVTVTVNEAVTAAFVPSSAEIVTP